MKIAIILYISICIILFSGCAVIQKLGGSGASEDFANYALASNGGTVSASNYTPGYNPFTAINGITSSERWDEGEGWECKFERRRPRVGGWSRLDPRTTLDFGSAWLEVQFNGQKLINKVTIYTLSSTRYPAARYGINDAWLQLWKEHGWTTVGEIEGGSMVSRVNLQREPVGGIIVFKFEPTKTDRIRFVVFRSNDAEPIVERWDEETRIERSVARVVEIEATGLEKISGKKAEPYDSTRLESAPEFVLPDLDGNWVRLSNLRGNIVIVTFWAAWSSDSKSQVRELVTLHDRYSDEGVVVIGISTDEGEAERIRPFVEANGLNYTILIADTSAKTAYGGIGSLPSIFIIDQEGNIYKKYFRFQGAHILELDIKKLQARQ